MCGEAMIDLFGSVPPSTDSWPLNVSSAVITKSFLGISFFFFFFFFQGWIHSKIQRLQSEDVERSLSVRDTTVSFSESQSLCCEMLKFK